MLTSNVNLNDRLVNGLVSKVMTFKFIRSDVNVTYIKFNDGMQGKLQYSKIILHVKITEYLLGRWKRISASRKARHIPVSVELNSHFCYRLHSPFIKLKERASMRVLLVLIYSIKRYSTRN